MLRTRFPRWLPLIVVLIIVMIGCAPAGGPAAPTGGEEVAPAEETAEKVTVTFWFNPPGGGEEANCFVETIIKPFNEQSETIFIEAVPQPDTWNATRTALAGGGGPDIVGTPGPSFVYELAQAGQLLPLDDLANEFGWADLFVPWALSLGEVDGTLYSLADEQETLVLYYNKTLFDQKGWEPPTTVDEMVALSAKIQAAEVIPFAHSNADWRPANEWYVGEFLNHVAGPDKVYEALTGQRPWTDPAFVEAIALLNDFQQKGYFMGGLEFYYTTAWDDWHIALATGEAAMNIEGTWSAFDINEIYFTEETGGNEWDWVPVPSKTGEAIFDIGMGHTWSINRNAKDPQAAAEFLTYFYSPEIQAKRFSGCGTAPAPVRFKPGALTGVDARIARIFEELLAASEQGNYGYTTWTFWPPKSDVYIYEEIEKVWAGEMTPLEYLEGLNELFQEELAAGAIPPIPAR